MYLATMDSIEQLYWGEFIELYKSMPCLWKMKSPEYSNRELKTRCYEKMVEKMREIDPDANREKVVKKINVFRTNYKRAMRKVKSSEESGAENIYESKLWYFDKLKFLEDEECYRRSYCTNDTKIRPKDEFRNDPLALPYELESTKPKKRKIAELNQIPVDDKLSETDCKISRKTSDANSILAEGWVTRYKELPKVQKVEDKLSETDSKMPRKSSDATSILAEGWATQYEELSKVQKIFTRTIFADVLFHGSLNNLTEDIVENVHKALRGGSIPTDTSHF